jgi:ubiquinone/menaquinone biosynthesis C-methylase UbiE
MKKAISSALFLLGFSGYLWGQTVSLDVPYVPTPKEVVAQMLKMANVGKDDLLYDLGCGDGRIVITAVEKFGCKGVGVDLNPVRIAESKANAEKAKVTDRVQFLNKNLFDTSFKDATVLAMYLLPSVNLKLRPRILRELKPGTRVLSHDFTMGEWEEDQREEIQGDTYGHNIYFWVVPANVSGTWTWTASGGVRYLLKLNQKFQKVSGTLTIGATELPLKEVKLRGDRLELKVDNKIQDNTVTLSFEGRANGNTIQGMENQKNGWKASRNPVTIKAVDADAKDGVEENIDKVTK